MSFKVERVTAPVVFGEGPYWDEETESLYFVDVFGKAIHKYTPSTNTHTKATVERAPSFVIPTAGRPGKFVIGNTKDLSLAEWDGKSERFTVLKTLATLTGDEENHAWNDAKVDSLGRLWAGSVKWKDGGTTENGTLYTLFAGGSVKAQVKNVKLSNGLAWNYSLNKLYYVDSFAYVVYQFDYNGPNCSVSNQEVIFNFKENNIPGEPDGMTIDADGNLWVACVRAGRVVKIDPRRPNTLLQTVELPTEQVTSVAFGGKNFEDLYVTTGNLDFELFTPIGDEPERGALYRISGLGVKGLRANKLKLEENA